MAKVATDTTTDDTWNGHTVHEGERLAVSTATNQAYRVTRWVEPEPETRKIVALEKEEIDDG